METYNAHISSSVLGGIHHWFLPGWQLDQIKVVEVDQIPACKVFGKIQQKLIISTIQKEQIE